MNKEIQEKRIKLRKKLNNAYEPLIKSFLELQSSIKEAVKSLKRLSEEN